MTRTLEPLTECHLVKKVRCGNIEAFNLLSEFYRPLLIQVAMKFVHNSDDARDIVQDTLIKALKNIAQVSIDRPIRPWLIKICLNMSIDFARNKKSHKMTPLLDYYVDHNLGVQESVESALTCHAVRLAIGEMPDQYRQIIEMRFMQQKPISEIAAELNTPEGTIKSWLFRARHLLRQSCNSELLD